MLSDAQEFYAATDKFYIPAQAKYKKGAPFLRDVDDGALASVHYDLRAAFKNFFEYPDTYRYPRFKTKQQQSNAYRTYCHYHKNGTGTIRLEQNGIVLPKLKLVTAAVSRRPQQSWHLQCATVSKSQSGKYFCSIVYRCQVKPKPIIQPEPENVVGLQYSVRHFYVDSKGNAADPPNWARESAEKMKKLQRKLARMQRGSNNYNETLQKLRLLHEHIANQRIDYVHKESRRLADTWDAVCVRSDNLRSAAQIIKKGNVLDSSFGRFRDCLKYKMERAGKHYVPVEKNIPTTKTCHVCGSVNDELDHAVKKWECPYCGAVLRRELNAAINIRNQGLAQLEAEKWTLN